MFIHLLLHNAETDERSKSGKERPALVRRRVVQLNVKRPNLLDVPSLQKHLNAAVDSLQREVPSKLIQRRVS